MAYYPQEDTDFVAGECSIATEIEVAVFGSEKTMVLCCTAYQLNEEIDVMGSLIVE
jgi:hypothetical protein